MHDKFVFINILRLLYPSFFCVQLWTTLCIIVHNCESRKRRLACAKSPCMYYFCNTHIVSSLLDKPMPATFTSSQLWSPTNLSSRWFRSAGPGFGLPTSPLSGRPFFPPQLYALDSDSSSVFPMHSSTQTKPRATRVAPQERLHSGLSGKKSNPVHFPPQFIHLPSPVLPSFCFPPPFPLGVLFFHYTSSILSAVLNLIACTFFWKIAFFPLDSFLRSPFLSSFFPVVWTGLSVLPKFPKYTPIQMSWFYRCYNEFIS